MHMAKASITAMLVVSISTMLVGCSSENRNSDTLMKENSANFNVAPMTATGPTKELFVRYITLRHLAPGLLTSIVNARQFDEGFNFTLNILVYPDKADEAQEWMENIDLGGVQVRWIATEGQHLLPGNTFVQDNFNFFYDSTNEDIRLIIPDNPQFIDTYSRIADLLNIPTSEMNSRSANRDLILRSMSGYGAGGNWEFLPGNLAVSLKPTLFEKFLTQIPDRSGEEFDYFYNEEYQFVEDDNPGLSEDELREKTIEVITDPRFTEVKDLQVKHFSEMKSKFEGNGYKVLDVDSYTPFKRQLTEVDHIDEHFAAFRTNKGGNCEVGLLIPDPLRSWEILQDENKPRTDEQKTRCRELSAKIYEDTQSIGELSDELLQAKEDGCFPLNSMTDDDFAAILHDYRSEFEKERAQIMHTVNEVVVALSQQGCQDPLLVTIPSQLHINIANSLVLTPANGTSLIVRPDSFYGPFEQEIERILEENEVPSLTANSLALAIGNGNLHCATNTITSGYTVQSSQFSSRK